MRHAMNSSSGANSTSSTSAATRLSAPYAAAPRPAALTGATRCGYSRTLELCIEHHLYESIAGPNRLHVEVIPMNQTPHESDKRFSFVAATALAFAASIAFSSGVVEGALASP